MLLIVALLRVVRWCGSILRKGSRQVGHCQPNVLGHFFNLRPLVPHDPDLEKLHILPVHLETLHIAQHGVGLLLAQLAEPGLAEEFRGALLVLRRGVLQEESQDGIGSLHDNMICDMIYRGCQPSFLLKPSSLQPVRCLQTAKDEGLCSDGLIGLLLDTRYRGSKAELLLEEVEGAQPAEGEKGPGHKWFSHAMPGNIGNELPVGFDPLLLRAWVVPRGAIVRSVHDANNNDNYL